MTHAIWVLNPFVLEKASVLQVQSRIAFIFAQQSSALDLH